LVFHFKEKQKFFFLINIFIFRYPNARQYKTVASALVKAYPFLESSTDGGEVSEINLFICFIIKIYF